MLETYNKKDAYYIGTFRGLWKKVLTEYENDICFRSIINKSYIEIGNVNTYFDSDRPLIWFKHYDNYADTYYYIAFPLNNTEFVNKVNQGYGLMCNFLFKKRIEL